MFKTKEEAIESAKDYLIDRGDYLSSIHVWADELVNQGGHTESPKCACKPRVEIDDGIRVIHHNLLVH